MAELLYIGLKGGIEERAVPAAGIPLHALRLVTPDSAVNRIRFACDCFVAGAGCIRLFNRRRPAVLFSTGGFVSVPATLAAWFRRIPIVMYLPDATPGKTVRLTRKLARSIAVSLPETAPALGGAPPVHVTGYPVREPFQTCDRAAARRELGLRAGESLLLVMGGSQGSAVVNDAVRALLPETLPLARVLHVSGPAHFDALEVAAASLPAELRSRYRLEPALDPEDMARAMFAADLAITRAGASILGELPMTGLPAIVIPLPINAQDENAKALELAGGCVTISQERAQKGELRSKLLELLNDEGERESMRANLERLRKPRAAQDIASLVLAASQPSS